MPLPRLSCLRTRFAPVVVVVTALLASTTAFAEGPKVNGLEIVPWSKKLEENRYKSGRDYKATIKFFRKKFAGSKRVKWHPEVNVTNVKYKYLQNLSKKRKWDGVNIYELPGGHVRIYVLPHKEAQPAAKPAAKPDS